MASQPTVAGTRSDRYPGRSKSHEIHMPIRVLIVDDSAVVRRSLANIVARDPELELAGTASNGSIALQKLTQVQPSIVVMDVEMPGMGGIEAVTRLRVDWPRLPVLMCSSVTARGAEITLRALAAGATDYVPKPTSLDAGAGLAAFEVELVEKIKGLCAESRGDPGVRPDGVTARDACGGQRVEPRRSPRSPAILAIGCSTGGPNALARVFQDLPPNLGVPIVITQHMPPLFTRMLGERLTASSRLLVAEARPGDVLEAGRAYIAPGDFHMVLKRVGTEVRVQLDQGPRENSCRPAVDVMFRSVATAFGAGAVAAVMTGMGRDGALGARAIADAGGWVVTQEAGSCVVPSMPNAVVEIGASSEVVDLERLGDRLAGRCRGFGARASGATQTAGLGSASDRRDA